MTQDHRLSAVSRIGGAAFRLPVAAMGRAQLTSEERLGVPQLPYYVRARGALLGDVGADVVTSALGFFEPQLVARLHAEAAPLLTSEQARADWTEQIHAWGDEHLTGPEMSEVADRLDVVTASAEVAGAPLFAGWMARPAPTSVGARTIHGLYALRELRGAAHLGALLCCGVLPVEAMAIRTPFLCKAFGWGPPLPVAHLEPAWLRAEHLTDVGTSRAFDVLSDPELDRLADLLDAQVRLRGAPFGVRTDSPALDPRPVAPQPATSHGSAGTR